MLMMLRVRRTELARASAVLLMSVAAMLPATRQVSAGAQGWNTTTAVVPGGSLTIDVTVPDVNIIDSTNINGCPLQGLGTDFITYSCDYSSSGIPAGTHLLQNWGTPNSQGLAGPFSEAVTYNAYGPLAGDPVSPMPCMNAGSQDPYTTNWTCTVTPLATQFPQSLTVYVLGSDQSFVILGMQGMDIRDYYGPCAGGNTCVTTAYQLGTCPFSFGDSTSTFAEMVNDTQPGGVTGQGISNTYSPPTLPTAVGNPLTVGGQQWSGIKAVFDCQQTQEKIPAADGSGGTLTFDVGTSASASASIAQTLPEPASPSPTTQVIYGTDPPYITSISPASGPAGSTATLTGTHLTAFAVTFGGTPGRGSTLGPSRGTTVNFGMQAAANVVCNDAGTSCTATSPGTGNPGDQYEVTLATSEGTSNTVDFTVTSGSAQNTTAPATSGTASSAAAATATPKPAQASMTASPTATPSPAGRH